MASEANDTPDVPFYTEPAERLSQGDIVFGLPAAVLQHPLTICRPGGKPKQGWFNTMADAVPPAFHAGTGETLHAKAMREPGLAMVIWEDCQIDKMMSQAQDAAKWFVSVAPIVPLSVLPEEHRDAIASGRRLAFFPLKAFPEMGVPESYVDLRLLWPIQQQALTQRLTTLTPEARVAMYAHLFRFLTARRFPAQLVCPMCHTEIDPSQWLEPAE